MGLFKCSGLDLEWVSGTRGGGRPLWDFQNVHLGDNSSRYLSIMYVNHRSDGTMNEPARNTG